MKMFARNLCPRALFFWNIFMCTPAPIMKKNMKIVWAGMSMRLIGGPPDGHTMGGYGGPCAAFAMWATCFHLCPDLIRPVHVVVWTHHGRRHAALRCHVTDERWLIRLIEPNVLLRQIAGQWTWARRLVNSQDTRTSKRYRNLRAARHKAHHIYHTAP